MSLKLTSTIKKEGIYFIATCIEFGVVSQGKTLDEANKNLKEAVELYLEDTKINKALFLHPSYISSFEVTVQLNMSKTFSGKFIIKILEKHFGFVQISQKGSHVKLQKVVDKNTVTTIVPNHKEIQNGTLIGILALAKVDKKEFFKFAKR